MLKLYQINARLLVKTFVPEVQSIAEIPQTFWQDLKSLGIDYIWLMGVWHTSPSSISKYCFHPNLVVEYSHANPKWVKSDVGGSPYAIDSYRLSSLVGSEADLLVAKRKINELGMMLILDFVPNHFNSESILIQKHPELFLSHHFSDETLDRSVYFENGDGFLAHGRDPYFDPWTDTVQLNYFEEETHQYMFEMLATISQYCDGVRCDMAMLILPDIFEKTWSNYPDKKVPTNFWSSSIPKIKSEQPGFIFLAEAYWDTEWRLQQDGFDFTYDKKFLDLLTDGNIYRLREHLSAQSSYQSKMVHFIENHDEPRSMTSLGRQKARAASVVISTIPGMVLYFDGQWEGARTKLPVQLVLPAKEISCACSVMTDQSGNCYCPCQKKHYRALLRAIDRSIFKEGSWELIDQSGLGDLLVWAWTFNDEKAIVLVNYTNFYLTGSLNLGFNPSQISEPQDVLCGHIQPNHFTYQDDNSWQISLAAYQSSIIHFRRLDQS